MLKILILFLFVCICSTSAIAATGCVKNEDGSRIYTTLNSGTDYSKNGTIVNLTGGCSWNFNVPSSPCTVSSPSKPGFLAQSSPQQCPIDDYIWVMLALVSGLGFYVIRQKNMLFSTIS